MFFELIAPKIEEIPDRCNEKILGIDEFPLYIFIPDLSV